MTNKKIYNSLKASSLTGLVEVKILSLKNGSVLVESEALYTERTGLTRENVRSLVEESLKNANLSTVKQGSISVVNKLNPTDLTTTNPPTSTTTNNYVNQFDACKNCRNSTCQLAGYSDEECFVKWSSVAELNAVKFYFKIKTPSTPSWFGLGFNPTEKKMVS